MDGCACVRLPSIGGDRPAYREPRARYTQPAEQPRAGDGRVTWIAAAGISSSTFPFIVFIGGSEFGAVETVVSATNMTRTRTHAVR